MRLSSLILGLYSFFVTFVCLYLIFSRPDSDKLLHKTSLSSIVDRESVTPGSKTSNRARLNLELGTSEIAAIESAESSCGLKRETIAKIESLTLPGLGSTPVKTEALLNYFQRQIELNVGSQIGELRKAVALSPDQEKKVKARFAEESLVGMLLEGEQYTEKYNSLIPLEQIIGQEAFAKYEKMLQEQSDRWQEKDANAEGKYLAKVLQLTEAQEELLKATLVDPERHIQKESLMLTEMMNLSSEQDQKLQDLRRRMESEDLFSEFESAHPELAGNDGTTDPYAYQNYLNEYQLREAATFLSSSQLDKLRDHLYDLP